MLAGVAVVGLDDVTEHERRAAVGVVELDETGQSLSALAGEEGEHAEQRQEGKDGPRPLLHTERHHERDRREREIDAVNPKLTELLA